ncbi:MAG: hypothetical protein R3E08_10175 [Thiotrichaceae bacterium]
MPRRSQTFNDVAHAVLEWHGHGEIEYVDFPEHLKDAIKFPSGHQRCAMQNIRIHSKRWRQECICYLELAESSRILSLWRCCHLILLR